MLHEIRGSGTHLRWIYVKLEEFDFEKVDLEMYVIDPELLELPNRLYVEFVC